MVASEVHYPKSLAEVLELQRLHPSLLLFAGGTDIQRGRGGRYIDLPPVVALLEGVPELHLITRTERFLELGSTLTLGSLLELKKGILPEALVAAIGGVATPAIRNLATLGGNLAARGRFMDLWGVLACLDTLVELRDPAGPRWVGLNRLCDDEGRPAFPAGSLLTRARLPVEAWNSWLLRSLADPEEQGSGKAVFTLLARVEKGLVSAFRLALAGRRLLRFPAIEARLVGTRLPLARKEIRELKEDYRRAASELAPLAADRLASLVELALEGYSR